MNTQAQVKAVTGRPCKKITPIAHSHGSAILLSAMSFTVKSDRYISQMIGLEPCPIPNIELYYPAGMSSSEYILLSQGLELAGIESLLGPNWDNQVSLLCQLSGQDSAAC